VGRQRYRLSFVQVAQAMEIETKNVIAALNVCNRQGYLRFKIDKENKDYVIVQFFSEQLRTGLLWRVN